MNYWFGLIKNRSWFTQDYLKTQMTIGKYYITSMIVNELLFIELRALDLAFTKEVFREK